MDGSSPSLVRGGGMKSSQGGGGRSSDQVERKSQGNTSIRKGRGKVVQQQKGDIEAEEEES